MFNSDYDLNKSRNKAHALIGFVVVNENIDKILELIKKSKDSKQAKEILTKLKWKISKSSVNFIKSIEENNNQLVKNSYQLSEDQVKAILDLRLHRLTSIERDDIKKDLNREYNDNMQMDEY